METENDLDVRALSILGSWKFRENVNQLPFKNEEDIAVEKSSKEHTLFMLPLLKELCLLAPFKKTCSKSPFGNILPMSFMS